MVRKPKKHHVVAASLVTIAGAATLVALLRGSGGATGSPAVRLTQVVDQCGNTVQTETGDPYLLAIRLDPPPVEHSAVDPAGVVESTAPDEVDMDGVPILANPRLTVRAMLDCGG
jgi:hypothetical protein